MSKHRSTTTSTVEQSLATLTIDELQTIYGIEIDPETGEVWDSMEGKHFNSVRLWILHAEAQDDDDNYGYRMKTHRGRYDEE